MPKTERTETFPINCEDFYNLILRYESYPDFVEGVDEIEVLEFSEKEARVQYTLNLVKKFSYILHLTHERPHHVSWTLESGDLFKKSDGFWKLEKISDEETKVTYGVDIEFKLFAPKAILKKLVEHNLPKMMQAYFEQAKKGV